MIKTKVVLSAAEDKCRCGNRFSHWKKFGHQDIRGCTVIKCKNVDLVGAFVQKANSSDKKIYIIPLCTEHAKSTEILDVLDSCNFVSSDFEHTCGTAPSTVEEAKIL
jgi:hypothetical protein